MNLGKLLNPKKPEIIVTCEKCGKREARVLSVMLDNENEVYNLRWWVPILVVIGVGIVAYQYAPKVLHIPGAILLAATGVYFAYKVIQERKNIVPGKEIYCHACYHFWWEKQVDGKTVKITAREGKKRTTNF
ncbi:MAG: hypothetical protein WBI14_01405 [Anaerolineaceae bacterium]